MKTIREKVLLDMKTRHPEYECKDHEIAIDLTLKGVGKVIDKEIKRCKKFIKEQKGYLKLKEMVNKEWLKGRIEECEYTIEMLQELKTRIT